MNRTEAREFMMTVFFQMEAQHDLDGSEDTYLKDLDKEQADYCRRIFRSFHRHREEIDRMIGEHSTGWKLSRMPKTDLATLREAVCELLYLDDIPTAVTVNEAVDIAKKYSTEQSPKFVNAVLGKIARDLWNGLEGEKGESGEKDD
jgi:N utilization substance protein B